MIFTATISVQKWEKLMGNSWKSERVKDVCQSWMFQRWSVILQTMTEQLGLSSVGSSGTTTQHTAASGHITSIYSLLV